MKQKLNKIRRAEIGFEMEDCNQEKSVMVFPLFFPSCQTGSPMSMTKNERSFPTAFSRNDFRLASWSFFVVDLHNARFSLLIQIKLSMMAFLRFEFRNRSSEIKQQKKALHLSLQTFTINLSNCAEIKL